MRRLWIVVVVAMAGCLQAGDVACSAGRICPSGYTCWSRGCFSSTETDACDGKGDGDACALPVVGAGTCVESGCIISICGNGILEPNELCDDGNTSPADGCSVDCRSDETCGNGTIDFFVGEQCDDTNTRSRDGCSSTCKTEQLQWSPVASSALPLGRGAGGMVYDSARHRLVMFGGRTEANIAGDTWESDGTGWIEVAPANRPPARDSLSLVYDPLRGRSILFGGFVGAARNDTWEYDGTTWTPIVTATSPPARASHAAVYDAARKRMILFGGGLQTNFDRFGDTWAYDGTNWTELHPATSPSPRSAHAMAYDPARDVIVLYGGLDPSGFSLGDTWEHDGTTWHQRSPSGTPPPLLHAHSMVYDPDRRRVVMFGGRNDTNGGSEDVWEYDGTSWTMRTPTAKPGKRYELQLAYDPTTSRLILFGGRTDASSTPFGDTWQLDATNWSGVGEVWPPYDFPGNLVYDESRGVAVVWGNLNNDFKTWELSDHHWTARAITGPTARSGHTMVYDAARKKVVLFGGAPGGPSLLDETWEYDGTSWKQITTATVPTARMSEGLAYDTVRHRVVMYGGFAEGANYLDDTWEYDGTDWHLIPTAANPGKRGTTMTFDRARSRVVLFGGTSSSGATLNDTWEYDGTTWMKAAPTVSPPPRTAALAYDASRRRVIMFSGTGAPDAWEYDGTTWREIVIAPSSPLPAPTLGAGVAYDSARGRVLVFGGQQHTGPTPLYSDTWALAYQDVAAPEACFAGIDLDSDGDKGCLDDECWGTCGSQCPPGSDPSLCATQVRCGDATCDPVENCRSCPSDCASNTVACPTVCGDSYCDTGETSVTCPGDCT